MKAIVYNGPKDASVAEVADPRIERPTDVLIRTINQLIHRCASRAPSA
jgi:glutathione-independent formaldehyde dehydrogenase